MAFAETIYPVGKIFYKGVENRSCKIMLRSTQIFYLTQKYSTAKNYGNVCIFRAKKNLRLFDLTHENVEKLLSLRGVITERTKGLLRLVMGTDVTIGEQTAAAEVLLGTKNTRNLPPYPNKRKGQRLSYTDINRDAFRNLSIEFLNKEGYDGYYAPKKPSIFHGGEFHSEIMLINAYQKIERTSGAPPVISHHNFKYALPRIFMEYCKRTTRLVRPYGGDLTIFCTGGMAVRMLLQQFKKSLPPKIRRTTDFDFTFAVPRRLKSQKELDTYVYLMRKIMTNHLTGFISYLNREYIGINARLRVNRHAMSKWSDPKIQVPGTGRKVYQVTTFHIMTGKYDVHDLVDSALAVYPRASRSMLNLPLSYKTGIPLQKAKHQLKDSLALLSGSFLYSGQIKNRNPLTGKKSNKGEKNTERVFQLLKISKKNRTLKNARHAAAPLLKNIALRNLAKARKNAAAVNRALKKIV